MEWTTQYGLGTMDYTLWTTQCSTHYCLGVIHYALFSLHYTNARCAMQCLPLVNLWWKQPQPWPCQTRPTSWVKHTGNRQRSKMDTKQKNQLSIYARKEYGTSSPWIIQLWSFCFFLLRICEFCSSLPAFVVDIRARFDKRYWLLLGLWWKTGVHVD